jgi:exonuclease SbcC
MIKRITLDNFMSHTHTVIEPAQGLTVLVGPNNCGKSAVVEALRAVCQNTETDFMVRHGAKEAVVTIETDDGHTIAWHRRKRSAAYVIDGERNDRPGTECLEKVHTLLKLPRVKAAESSDEFDVHFGDQKSPIFLLNETGSRAATFFATSSDAERLLQMQRNHATTTRTDKEEEKRRSATITSLDQKLATLVPLDEISPLVADLERHAAEIKESSAQVERLQQLSGRLKHTARLTAMHTALRDAASGLVPPPNLADEQSLARLITRYAMGTHRRRVAARENAALTDLAAPPPQADIVSLQKTCERRRALQIRINRLSAVIHGMTDLREPPIAGDTAPLARLVDSLQRLRKVRERIAARAELLHSLPLPPEQIQTQPLVDLVSKLRSAQSAAERRRQLSKAAVTEFAAAGRDIETWASQNPLCPVCNGPVDSSRLLATAGEHAHG